MASIVALQSKAKGDQLQIDVLVKAGSTAYGIDLRFQYDLGVLAYASSQGGTLQTSTGWVVLANEPLPGLISFAALDFSMQTPIGTKQDTLLASLVFDVRSINTATAIKITDARFTNSAGLSIATELPPALDLRTGQVSVSNQAPIASDLNLTINEDQVQAGFLPQAQDPDGDPVSYLLAAAPKYGDLEIKSNGQYRYVPLKDYAGLDEFQFIVSDNKGSSNRYKTTIDIKSVNDPPTVQNTITLQQLLVDQSFRYTIPSDLFVDVDSPSLRYSVNAQGGQSLPSWLSFDTGTKTLSGVPTLSNLGTVVLEIVAGDGIDEARTTIAIQVSTGNRAPIAQSSSVSTNEDAPLVGRLPQATDPDGDAISYALVNDVTSGRLELRSDGTYRYVPKADFAGSDQFDFSVSDGKGEGNQYTIKIDIKSVNDPPVVVKSLADWSLFAGERANYVIPAESFSDVDSSSLSYLVQGSQGSPLANWLRFDASTRTLSGDVPTSDFGATELLVTASDGSLTVTTTLRLNIVSKTIGSSLAEFLTGSPANDRIISGGGDDTIQGGAGVDTLVLEVSTQDIVDRLAGSLVDASGLKRLASSKGVIQLEGVERLQLSDGLYAFDTQPPLAGFEGGKIWQIAALYGLAFGRQPASTDYGSWVARADKASSMANLAQQMLDVWAPELNPVVLATYIYGRLTGELLDEAIASSFVKQSVGSGKTYETQGALFAWAASLELNAVNLVGINYSVQRIDGGG